VSLSIGIDSGSTATKGILLNGANGGQILRRFLAPTSFRPQEAIEQAWSQLCEGLTERPHLTLTGYGRGLIDFADKQVTEITCHGVGARFLCSEARTIIDIGGQDSKVIHLDEEGKLTDFLMNDKCAAGTGRFLEVISHTLGAQIHQLDELVTGVAPHAISSMCTVFAESEVISLRSAGVAPESILSGIVYSMARRSANFIGRLGVHPQVLFTGGVSRCNAFRQHLSDTLNTPVATHSDAQFAGAIGAALMGCRQKKRRSHAG